MLGELLNELSEFLANIVPGTYSQDGASESSDDIIYLMEYKGYGVDAFCGERQVQVNVRNRSNSVAKRTSWCLFNGLQAQVVEGALTLSTGRYLLITFKNPPFLLDRDSKNRAIYTFNLSICTQYDKFDSAP